MRGSRVIPKMAALRVSNALLGDRGALDAAWARDGYWFFRNVIDQGAVGRLRDVYLALLADLGQVEAKDTHAIWTGASLDNFPHRMSPLSRRKAWKPFVAEPPVHAFFSSLLGDEPFWVPTTEYRATPPEQNPTTPYFNFVHQDSFYNQGIPYRIVWFPLAEIDEEVGGLALAEGLHNGPCLHDLTKPPMFPIPADAIPDAAWRRVIARPGDLLMMDLNLPHSGLANHSNRFRLSLDIRVMPKSGKVPIIGTLISIDSRSITIAAEDGRPVRLDVDENTYCRDIDGKKIPPERIKGAFAPGTELIIAETGGRAQVIRPPH